MIGKRVDRDECPECGETKRATAERCRECYREQVA